MSALVPMAAKAELDRAHSMRADLDWLPRSFQWVRWTVAGTVWAGIGTATIALIASTHASFIYIGKGGWGLVAAGYYAGEKAARTLLRRRLARLAGGQIDLLRLRQTDDGELVHVRGKIRAVQSLPPFDPDSAPAVYRRRHIRLDMLEYVHEQAVDFQIVSSDGQRATVRVEHSRFVADPPKRNQMVRLQMTDLDQLSLMFLGKAADKSVAQARKRLSQGKKAAATGATVSLFDGDEVAVVGYKSRTVDPTVADRLGRDIPYATVLQGGSELPLIVTLATGPALLGATEERAELAGKAPAGLPPVSAIPEPDDAG